MATPPLKRPRKQDDVGRDEQVKRPHTNGFASPKSDHDGKPVLKKEQVEKHEKVHRERRRSRSREGNGRRGDKTTDNDVKIKREGSRDRGDRRERRGDRERIKEEDRDSGRSRTDDRRNGRRDERTRSRSPGYSNYESRRNRTPPRGPRSSITQFSQPPCSSAPSRPAGGSSVSSSQTMSARPSSKNLAKLDPARRIDTVEELEDLMKSVMGFGNFRSTKDTKVPGNDRLYGVRKEKKTEYRQYMNRAGGFNRPLSPTR